MQSLVLLLILAALCVPAPGSSALASSPDYSRMKKSISALIARDMARTNVKGLSIAVVDGRDTVWAEGFGFANEASRIPATPETVYRAGSISKCVTSLHVMQLVDAGLVDMDADIHRYVPEFSVCDRFGQGRAITPRMLMSHRSGLPTDVVAGMWSEHPMTLAEFIPTLRRECLASPPATEWRYSNVAYSLLGRMVEKIENKPFADAMREGLLRKLGMTGSGYVLDAQLAARFASGYMHGLPAPCPTLRDQPTGSLYTTVTDLAALVKTSMAGGGVVISERSMREMLRPQLPGLELDFGFKQGFGFMLSGLTLADGRELVWHGGTAIPHQAFLAFDPESRLGVVILCNSLDASHFISELAVATLESALEAKTGRRAPPRPRRKTYTPRQLSPAQMAPFAGYYATYSGMLGTVRVEGGRLTARVGDGSVMELATTREGDLLVRSHSFLGLIPYVRQDLTLEPMTIDARDILVLRGNAMPAPFERVRRQPIPRAWMDRLGTYATSRPGEGICYKTLELTVKDGLLIAIIGVSTGGEGSPVAQAPYPLVIVSDDEAVIAGIGIGTGSVVRAEGSGIYFSGYDFKKVR